MVIHLARPVLHMFLGALVLPVLRHEEPAASTPCHCGGGEAGGGCDRNEAFEKVPTWLAADHTCSTKDQAPRPTLYLGNS